MHQIQPYQENTRLSLSLCLGLSLSLSTRDSNLQSSVIITLPLRNASVYVTCRANAATAKETPTPHRRSSLMSGCDHIYSELCRPPWLCTPAIVASKRPMSAGPDEIRPWGRGLAQLATGNATDEARRGQRRGTALTRRHTRTRTHTYIRWGQTRVSRVDASPWLRPLPGEAAYTRAESTFSAHEQRRATRSQCPAVDFLPPL